MEHLGGHSSPQGDLRVNFLPRVVEVASGGHWCRLAVLTPTECRLLCLLLSNAGRVIDRRLIVEAVWKDRAPGIPPAAVRKRIGTLRRKLEGWSMRVRTVYGGGYGYIETDGLAARARSSDRSG